jgi:DNA-binding transcriptional regulator YhcF (GntR family)
VDAGRLDTARLDIVILDPDAPDPPFEQVRRQIAAAIETGVLAPAVRLPTVRSLAVGLGLAVNTVARSYRELELAGLLETRGRHGTFVAPRLSGNRKLAAGEAKNFARRMRELGIGKAETMAMLRHEVERPDAPETPPWGPSSRRTPGSTAR